MCPNRLRHRAAPRATLADWVESVKADPMLRFSLKSADVILVCQRIALTLAGSALTMNAFASVPEDVFVAADGAAASANKASEFVRGKHEELQGALKASKEPKSDPKLLAIFDAMLDYEALTRDSLGAEWDALTPEQRTEFGGILKQLIQKSYRKNLSDTSGYEVQYVGVDDSAEGAVVKTLAQNKVNKREKPLGINYVVSSTASGFKVRDVVTDEVSLVGNYRNQFKRIIKRRASPA